MVDPKAYVPLCRKIADNNIKVYLIKMPWGLASKGYNIPKELNLFSDTTKTYILAGHSQGAKMAGQFVYENPNLIDPKYTNILLTNKEKRLMSVIQMESMAYKVPYTQVRLPPIPRRNMKH